MSDDFIRALVNACNSNMHHSDVINTNFAVKGKQIVLSVEGNFDLDKYIQDVNVEVVERSIAGKFFNTKFFPLSTNGVECVYNEDGTVREFRFNITPEVVHNLKLYFASSFQKSIGDEIQVKFIKAPDKLRGIIIEFLRCIKVGRMGGGINDLYSIELNDVESADAQMNKTLKDIYVEMFSTHLKKCGLKPSDFFQLVDSDLKPLNFLQLVDNRLYIKHVTDIGVVNNVTKYITGCIAGSVIAVDNNSSKAKNIRDVIRSRIFKCTTTDEEKGVLIHGYDNDFFVDESKVMGENKVKDGSIAALIPLVKVNDQSKPEPLSTEEADRINKAFRKEGFGNILIDIRGQTKTTQPTDSEEPVSEEPLYGIPNMKFALLIPELRQSPIAYNEASKCFEYAVNLGNLFKSREHSNLSDDLGRILLPKFYKDGYLDKPGLSKASNYIWQCLSKSKFGVEGYDMPELVEFVNQKIKEWRIIEEHQDKNIVIPKDENIVISKAAGFRPSSLAVPSGSKVGGSRGSLSSGNSDSSSRSVSPMPRNSSDSSLSSGLPSMPFFGANCVDDLATAGTSAPVQMPTVMEASIETSQEVGKSSGKYGQSSQILPSIEITGVADENSKSSYDKPVPSFERSNSAPGDMVNQLVKQAASEPKVAPEDNRKTPSKPEPPLSEVNSVKVDQSGQAIPKVAELSHVGKVRHKMKEESQKEKPKKKGGCIVM